MRTHNMARTTPATFRIPRGWMILGLAMASWALAIAVGSSLAQVFSFLLATV